MRPLAFALLCLLALAAGCFHGAEVERPERAPAPPTGTETAAGEEDAAAEPLTDPEPETLAGGLEVPWGVAFLPDGGILIAERPGRVRLVADGRLVDEPVAEIDVSGEGEAGLLGLALHPDYPDEPFAYAYYTAPNLAENRISRFRVVEDGPAGLAFEDEEVVLDGIPASTFHDGGRIAFGPDGRLYVTTGDAQQPALAADRGSLAGKILRLEPDGSVPDDNPFDGSPVWSYGHRNVQGLAWDSQGRLYASDHGPTGELGLCCHDELHLVEEGGFHGWPLRMGTAEAVSPGEIGLEGPPDEPVAPLAESGGDTTWAPGGIAVDEPSGGPTAVLMANLAGRELRRFVLTEDGAGVEAQATILGGLGRLRTIAAGPDGCFYATTSNRDGRGDPAGDDDRLVRLCPSA